MATGANKRPCDEQNASLSASTARCASGPPPNTGARISETV